MSAIFEDELAHLLGIEGGYSNNASDRGGATNFGITEAVARGHGYNGDMKSLTLGIVAPWYRSDYWDRQSLDEIAAVSRLVASELFDTGVNCGVGNAGMFLQRMLNALNMQGTHYPDIPEDGGIGAGTVQALRSYMARRGKPGEVVLLKGLNCLQGEYYIRISQSRKANEDFVFGWLNNRIAL